MEFCPSRSHTPHGNKATFRYTLFDKKKTDVYSRAVIPKPIDSISKIDIEALIQNAVRERKTMEYKETLPGRSDHETREFLADVSSFANTAGGDIIYGVAAERDESGNSTGAPEEVPGLPGISPDTEVLRLENMLRDGLDPRIPGISIVAIPDFTKGPVIVIRIPKSWLSPHLIIFKNLSRFYIRNSAGKGQMDVREIRGAFEASSSIKTRIEVFRIDRLSRVQIGETPVAMRPGPKCVLHVVPLSALPLPDSDAALAAYKLPHLRSFFELQTRRWNFDGLVWYHPQQKNTSPAYLQIYRNGSIEFTFCCRMLGLEHRQMLDEVQAARKGKVVDASYLEYHVRVAFSESQKLLPAVKIDGPVVVMLSIVGVKGMEILNDTFVAASVERYMPIDRDVLQMPETLVESLIKVETDAILRPLFNVMWQASGWERSLCYDQGGKWDGGKSYQ